MPRRLIVMAVMIITGCVNVSEPPPAPFSPGRASPLRREPAHGASASCDASSIAASREIGLSEILELVDQSPRLRAEKEKIARETGAVVQGSYPPNPVLTLETEMMPIDDMGFGNARNRVRIAQRFETAGKADARVGLARAKRNEAEAAWFHLRNGLMAECAQTYFAAVLTRRKTDALARMHELKQQTFALGQEMNKRGRVSDLDLISYRLSAHRTAVSLQEAKAEEEGLLRNLEGKLGLEAGSIAACRDELPLWHPLDPAEAARKILSRNSEIIQLDRKIATARAELELRESGAWTDLTAGLGYSRGAEMGNDRDDYAGAFLQIPLPLVDRNQGSIQSARAAVRLAEISIEESACRLLDEWAESSSRWKNLEAGRKLYAHKIIPELQKSVSLERSLVESGRRSVRSLLEAAVRLEEAVTAMIDLEKSLSRLRVNQILLEGGDQG